jgi:hypothetical protein
MPMSTRDAALAKELKDFLDRLLRRKARQKPQRRARTAKRLPRAVVGEVAIVRLNPRQLLDRIERRRRRPVTIVII